MTAAMILGSGSVPVFADDGILLKGTIVRHLILPQHTKNSIEVLQYLDQTYGNKILVSLMGQYVPLGDASRFPEINRKITSREYNKVLAYLEDTSLDGYAQELDSADANYVPEFDISSF